MTTLQSIAGLLVFSAIAWLMSENRNAVNWRIPAMGILIQLLLALVLLKFPGAKQFFLFLNEPVLLLQSATEAGTAFVFGYLGGGHLPFTEKSPGSSYILAFRALPLVVVISALTALLIYWRILPWIVKGFSRFFRHVLELRGPVSLAATVNIFVGMVEAPLFIRPYLGSLSRADLLLVMTAGMSTIAGTMLMLYAGILAPVLPNAVGHLLIASIISVPAAVTFARLMIPAGQSVAEPEADIPQEAESTMDAITQGTQRGVELLINISAMLIVLVALVSLLNSLLGLLPHPDGEAITLQRILGILMAPLAWLMSIPWSEAQTAGALMGTKTILNEMLAYLQMADLPKHALTERSRLIMSYALCGFANPGSLGIMIAGLSTMTPERRQEITALGLKSIVAGTLATSSTAAVVGILI